MQLSILKKLRDPKSARELRHLMNRIYLEEIGREAVRRVLMDIEDEVFSEALNHVHLRAGVDDQDIKALVPKDGMTKTAFINLVALSLELTKNEAREAVEDALASKAIGAYQQHKAVLITTGKPPGLDWSKVFKSGEPMKGPAVKDAVMKLTGKSKAWAQTVIKEAGDTGILHREWDQKRQQTLSFGAGASGAVEEPKRRGGKYPPELIAWVDGDVANGGDPDAEGPWNMAGDEEKERALARWLRKTGGTSEEPPAPLEYSNADIRKYYEEVLKCRNGPWDHVSKSRIPGWLDEMKACNYPMGAE